MTPDNLTRLRELASATRTEWHVANPATQAYCMSFGNHNSRDPEGDARAWLKDHRERFPGGRFADYQVVKAESQTELQRLAGELVDKLSSPIDIVLHCPACGVQHIDSPEPAVKTALDPNGVLGWPNPPHRSHLCHGCGFIWRPADVPTNGVQAVQTKGKADSPLYTGATAPLTPSADQLATVSVLKEDANRYCEILRLLGMEDEGDPVAEVQRLQDRAAHAIWSIWEALPGYLIDNCEGTPVTEEMLQRALEAMLKDPKYAAPDWAAKGATNGR